MRDAGEAQRHRIEALERELDDARRELELVRRLSVDVLDLETERARLAIENRELAAALAPWRRRTVLALAGGVVIAVAAVVAASSWSSARERELAAQRAQVERDSDVAFARLQETIAARTAELEARVAAAEALVETAESRERIARDRADALGRIPPDLRPGSPAHTFGTWTAMARVERVTGRELPTRCEVQITATASQCHARVRCPQDDDEIELYPFPGTAGWIPECTSDASGPRGAIDGRITEDDGDPSFALDVQARRLVIADRDWRAELTLIDR